MPTRIKREFSEEDSPASSQPALKKVKAEFGASSILGQYVYVVEWTQYQLKKELRRRRNKVDFSLLKSTDHGIYGMYTSLAEAEKSVKHHLRFRVALWEGYNCGKGDEDDGGPLDLSLKAYTQWENAPEDVRQRMQERFDDLLDQAYTDVEGALEAENTEHHDATVDDLIGARFGSEWYWDAEEMNGGGHATHWQPEYSEECFITLRKLGDKFDESD
jgi:hypothetical protein